MEIQVKGKNIGVSSVIVYILMTHDADSLSIGENQRNGLWGFLCVKQKEAGANPALLYLIMLSERVKSFFRENKMVKKLHS